MQPHTVKLLVICLYFGIEFLKNLLAFNLSLATFLCSPNFDQFVDISVDFRLEAEEFHAKSLNFISEFGVGVGEDVEGVGFELGEECVE